MGQRVVCVLAIVAVLMGAMIAPAPADEMAQAGRQMAAKWKNAVVTVNVVLKIAGEGEGEPDDEVKVETTGTVIDPSGLTVVALSATVPTEITAGEEDGGDSSTEVKDTKILLADGQEVPAKIVLRDRELDLAFVRPSEKLAKPMDAIDLTKAVKVDLMDQVACLYRLGMVASRSIAACCDRVQAVIEKPRTFYSPGLPMMGASLGAPVFTMDGSPVGLLLLRTLPGGSDSYQVSGIGADGMMYIILPASDVLEAAKQAVEAK